MPLKSNSFVFIKLCATGNDFILADLLTAPQRELWPARFSRPEEIKRLCDRHWGLGADGLILLKPETGVDFRWEYFNSDGGRAELCGNAARAVTLYMHQT